MRVIKVAVVLGLAVSFCMAAPLSISGTVTDSASGAGLSGVSVSLFHCGLSDSTNSSGVFTLTRPSSGIIGRGFEAIAPAAPVMSAQGEIRLDLQEPARVTFKTYSVEGKQIGSMERTLGAGAHSIMPAKANSGVYLYQVVVNGKAYTLQQANVNGRAYTRANVGGGAIPFQGLAKSSAALAALFPDTIVVYKTGYANKLVLTNDSIASGLAIKLTANPTTCNTYTSTAKNGGTTINGYNIEQDMWNLSNYPTTTQTLYVCSYNNWYVVENANNNSNDGAVKTYPDVQKNFSNLSISSAHTITATYAGTPPHGTGMIYDVAFDIWTKSNGSTVEFMIWTENGNQLPSGSVVATVTLSSRTYKVWRNTSGSYLAFVPTVVCPSGVMNILEIFQYAIAQGWFATTATMTQLDYGIEFVSTNSTNATFRCDNFSITNN